VLASPLASFAPGPGLALDGGLTLSGSGLVNQAVSVAMSASS
jgi:hypothetical protein